MQGTQSRCRGKLNQFRETAGVHLGHDLPADAAVATVLTAGAAVAQTQATAPDAGATDRPSPGVSVLPRLGLRQILPPQPATEIRPGEPNGLSRVSLRSSPWCVMYPDPRYQSPEPNRPSLAPRRVRPAHVAAAAAVAVAAIGLMGLKFVTLPEAAPVAPGDALKIEVVTPVEPKVRAGSVMDVGELVDGFRYVPPAPRERFTPIDIAWEDDDLDLAPYAPPVRRAEVRRYASYDDGSRAEREPPRREREERRWFGFDNPMPDYRAERQARQARLEAMEAERRAQFEAARVDRRRYAPPPPRGRAPEPAIGRPIDEPTEGPWGPEVG